MALQPTLTHFEPDLHLCLRHGLHGTHFRFPHPNGTHLNPFLHLWLTHGRHLTQILVHPFATHL